MSIGLTNLFGLLPGRSGSLRVLRNWLPPILFDLLAGLAGTRISVKGSYKSWKLAASRSRGYESLDILERVKQTTRDSISNPKKFERDGVAVVERQHPFALIAILLDTALRNGQKLSVLDFGGSLGSSYYQCKDFLVTLTDVRWSVVEQTHFVDCGRSEFQSKILRFYSDIEECYRSETPNVVLFSSVLQYIEHFDIVLRDVTSRMPDTVIIDRTPFVTGRTRIAIQSVPKNIGMASYPIRLFAHEDLTKCFTSSYKLISKFSSSDPPIFYRGKLVTFDGLVFQKANPE